MLTGLIIGHSLLDGREKEEESGILGGPAALVAEFEAFEGPSLMGIAQASALSIPDSRPVSADLAPASLTALPGSSSPVNLASAMGAVEDIRSGSSIPSTKGLPTLSRYFIQPTSGRNWGILHASNAVDIANVCGTPVLAAAEGIVVDASASGWNGGYGNYLTIEHPNGARTKYAHLEKVSASTGDEVRQGETIATIGNSGYVHGTTGCHLHFEVYGAKNPFVKK